jgi:predicted secreted protein
MVTVRIVIFMMILFSSLTVFASQNGSQHMAQVLTKDNNGNEITLSPADIFEVRLKQPGATGYLWQVVDLDQAHLLVLETKETPLKEGRIVGAPLLKIWKIKALKAGQTDLKILLYRPWEGTARAAESFEVRINIR